MQRRAQLPRSRSSRGTTRGQLEVQPPSPWPVSVCVFVCARVCVCLLVSRKWPQLKPAGRVRMTGRQRASCPGMQLGQRAATEAGTSRTRSGTSELMVGREPLDNRTYATMEKKGIKYEPYLHLHQLQEVTQTTCETVWTLFTFTCSG